MPVEEKIIGTSITHIDKPDDPSARDYICPILKKRCMMIENQESSIPTEICTFFSPEGLQSNKWEYIYKHPEQILEFCNINIK